MLLGNYVWLPCRWAFANRAVQIGLTIVNCLLSSTISLLEPHSNSTPREMKPCIYRDCREKEWTTSVYSQTGNHQSSLPASLLHTHTVVSCIPSVVQNSIPVSHIILTLIGAGPNCWAILRELAETGWSGPPSFIGRSRTLMISTEH